MAVDVFGWNPRRPVRPWFPANRVRRPLNNFGDLIGPVLVRRILAERCGDAASGEGRLLSVGSVMHFSRPGDVIWGTGVNGKVSGLGAVPDVDVRAVRGPLTRDRLIAAGAKVPAVFGDPGLLWARYFPVPSVGGGGVVVVPNLNDAPRYRGVPGVINPRRPPLDVAARIASADLVVGSSLHGVVLADSFGVPARLVRSFAEHPFKYEDYYRGSGRAGYSAADTVAEAVALGGEPAPVWDPQPLLDAFPIDLWRPTNQPR